MVFHGAALIDLFVAWPATQPPVTHWAVLLHWPWSAACQLLSRSNGRWSVVQETCLSLAPQTEKGIVLVAADSDQPRVGLMKSPPGTVHLQDRPQWAKPGAWTPAGRIGNPCLSKAVGRPWFGCVADSAQKRLVGSLPDAALEANLQAISGLAFRSQPVELRAVQLLNYES
ncbi:Hypothetical predicted protein [Podarcis lilfordi]|uniref:Uncharacterized protein n=1 Tax=Podarcis lilfordi TaxID=74358 RepID=A0AA35KD61_9SAUR|nr:Hypothetical predicted protein [Podarcis lilfordi]